jgi:translation initiation factor 3 subunit C
LYTYLNRVEDTRAAATMALLCVEHMYYKHNTIAVAVSRANAFSKVFGRYADLHPASLGKDTVSVEKASRDVKMIHPGSYLGTPYVAPVEYNPSLKVEELCKYIFKNGDDRSKTRALLCSVYYHALHDNYHHARDLFLISHVQETIEKTDTETQILYNRALVTLGLSAFRLGLVQKAHECLSGICSGRVRDLLAQGHSKYFDKDPEQEKIERRRQMPYHMHINPDLLESCHLISAMLLELPQMSKPSTRQMIISKQFRKYMNSYRQQLFTGPPENTRDYVMSSAKALLAGEWKKACQLLLANEVWSLIPNDGGEKVKDMLRVKIKEEAIRIYLLNYGAHYESISLQHICAMFEMDESSARKIVSKMIHNKEISGAWEQPADVLVLYKVDPSQLQSLCQVVAEKVAMLVESNERLMDPLAGAYGYKDDWTSRDPRKHGETGGRAKNGSWKSQQSYTKYPPARAGRGGGRGGGRGAYGGGSRQGRVGGDKQGHKTPRAPQQQPGIEMQQPQQAATKLFRWGSTA